MGFNKVNGAGGGLLVEAVVLVKVWAHGRCPLPCRGPGQAAVIKLKLPVLQAFTD